VSLPLGLIVAVSQNGVIGTGNELPWHLPQDLKHFRRTTMGHSIILGRKTWDSIGRPLKGRHILVVSRSLDLHMDGVDSAPSLDAAMELARAQDPEPIIAGGSSIYALALPQVTRIYRTRVLQVVDGDAHFPELGPQWTVLESTPGEGLIFEVLERG